MKKPETLKEHKGVLEFSHVDFKYTGAEHNVLSDIDFKVEPGKITAIIGSTYCGKSTLVNLIPRFYDVTGGQITLDGKDIRRISMEELREEIGFVPQKGVLFSGTIASNLRFGKADATDEDIKEAAEIAQATEFIETKKKNTTVRLPRAEVMYLVDRNSVLRLQERLRKRQKYLYLTIVFPHLI